MVYGMERVASIETTLSHKLLVSGRVSFSHSLTLACSDFIDFLHAPWQEMSDRHVSAAFIRIHLLLFVIRYSLFVLAFCIFELNNFQH